MLIDTHCHLNFHAFNDDVEQVIKRAKDAGVEKMIIPGAKLDSSRRVVEIAQKYPGCFAAVGIHPHHEQEIITEELIRLAQENKVVAIGEVGLDFTPTTKQIELFSRQLEIATKLNLPVIIHCREAFRDLLSLMKKFLKNHQLIGVFHCFGGTLSDLKKVLEMGFYVGFDGNITYKTAQNLRDLVKETPLEKMLLETDSPFLSPIFDELHSVPLRWTTRGKRNEPKNVKIIAETVSYIKEVDLETVKKVTSQSAQNLFRLNYV